MKISKCAHLVHDVNQGTAHQASSHLLDLVYYILGPLDLLQQQTDVGSSVYQLLIATKKQKKVKKLKTLYMML